MDEGARVSAGQPIVQFETNLIDLQIDQQKARVAEMAANLVKAERGPRSEEIARARAEAEQAEHERSRQAALLGQGLVAQQAYDAAATQAKTALETFRELERGNRPEDIAVFNPSARSRAAPARLPRTPALGKRGPGSGIGRDRESLDLRPGDLVAANQPVARMLEPSQLWVRVFVPEPQLGPRPCRPAGRPDRGHAFRTASSREGRRDPARSRNTRPATSRPSISGWTRSSASRSPWIRRRS